MVQTCDFLFATSILKKIVNNCSKNCSPMIEILYVLIASGSIKMKTLIPVPGKLFICKPLVARKEFELKLGKNLLTV